MTDREHQHNQRAREAPLQGWKEIAAYLGRDARTAQRWEASAGLPVRRHGGSAGSVYAYPSELQSWRASRRAKPGGEAASTPAREQPRRRLISALAIAGTVVVALLVIRFGPVLNPPSPIAEAAEEALHVELVWDQAVSVSPEGSVSPDGNLMTYVDWQDEGNLAIRNLVTGDNRRLTHTADGNSGRNPDGVTFASDSRISPDGKRVAYSWARPIPQGETAELRVLSLEGDETEPLTIWSPAEGSWAGVQDWFPGQRPDRSGSLVPRWNQPDCHGVAGRWPGVADSLYPLGQLLYRSCIAKRRLSCLQPIGFARSLRTRYLPRSCRWRI